MPDQVEKIYDVCDEVYGEFKNRLSHLFSEMAERLIEKLKESEIPLVEKTGINMCSDSKQKLIAEDRLLSLCGNVEFEFRFDCLGKR